MRSFSRSLVTFLLTIVINALSRLLLWRVGKKEEAPAVPAAAAPVAA